MKSSSESDFAFVSTMVCTRPVCLQRGIYFLLLPIVLLIIKAVIPSQTPRIDGLVLLLTVLFAAGFASISVYYFFTANLIGKFYAAFDQYTVVPKTLRFLHQRTLAMICTSLCAAAFFSASTGFLLSTLSGQPHPAVSVTVASILFSMICFVSVFFVIRQFILEHRNMLAIELEMAEALNEHRSIAEHD